MTITQTPGVHTTTTPTKNIPSSRKKIINQKAATTNNSRKKTENHNKKAYTHKVNIIAIPKRQRSENRDTCNKDQYLNEEQ